MLRFLGCPQDAKIAQGCATVGKRAPLLALEAPQEHDRLITAATASEAALSPISYDHSHVRHSSSRTRVFYFAHGELVATSTREYLGIGKVFAPRSI